MVTNKENMVNVNYARFAFTYITYILNYELNYRKK